MKLSRLSVELGCRVVVQGDRLLLALCIKLPRQRLMAGTLQDGVNHSRGVQSRANGSLHSLGRQRINREGRFANLNGVAYYRRFDVAAGCIAHLHMGSAGTLQTARDEM